MILAKNIWRYYSIYRQHLMNNKLKDDSSTISIDELVDFVENNITDEDRLVLADEIWN